LIIEGVERDVDDTVRAEDDNETDEAPEDSALALCALPFISSVCNEFERTPDEDDKRNSRKEQYQRIDYLRNNLIEECVEFGREHLPYLNACGRSAAARGCIIAEGDGTSKDIHEAPDRDHYEEADETPEHEVLPFLLRIVGIGAKDERLECTPEEDDERYGEEDWDENVVDGVDNERTGIRDIVYCSHRNEWQRKRGKSS